MFRKGEYIIYGTTGVCHVEDVGIPEGLSAPQPGRTYYTLSPVFSAGLIYIPTDSNAYMRPILTKEEAEALIRSIPQIDEHICESKNPKELSCSYQAAIQSHDCADLLCLIKSVYLKIESCTARGRRPSQTDLRYRKRAEDLLYGELSVALGIPMDEVEPYIHQVVKSLEDASAAC